MGISFFTIWLLTTPQICPKIIKITEIGLKFCQTQNKPSKVYLRFLIACPSGKILPNQVTLVANRANVSFIGATVVRITSSTKNRIPSTIYLERDEDSTTLAQVVGWARLGWSAYHLGPMWWGLYDKMHAVASNSRDPRFESSLQQNL